MSAAPYVSVQDRLPPELDRDFALELEHGGDRARAFCRLHQPVTFDDIPFEM